MDIIEVVAGIAMGEADAADNERILRVAIGNGTNLYHYRWQINYYDRRRYLFRIQKSTHMTVWVRVVFYIFVLDFLCQLWLIMR